MGAPDLPPATHPTAAARQWQRHEAGEEGSQMKEPHEILFAQLEVVASVPLESIGSRVWPPRAGLFM